LISEAALSIYEREADVVFSNERKRR
jgi:hypothetical protein